jgi:methylmalonyl-CoA mutase C-terminal domain/subunit
MYFEACSANGSRTERIDQNQLKPRIRVLIAKVGLDGHEVGARVIARGLASEGMEVIYTGLRRTPQQIVAEAIQEDVDAIGISILSGAHMELVPRVCRLLREKGAEDIIVVLGGIIPQADIPVLREAGVAAVFHPGTTVTEVAHFIKQNLPERHAV